MTATVSSVGSILEVIGFTPDGTKAYVPASLSHSRIINTATNTLNSVQLPYGYQIVCSANVSVPAADVPPPAYAAAVVPVDGAGADAGGPSAADGVNLVSRSYENSPGPDAVVRNATGPGVVFARYYRSVTATANSARKRVLARS